MYWCRRLELSCDSLINILGSGLVMKRPKRVEVGGQEATRSILALHTSPRISNRPLDRWSSGTSLYSPLPSRTVSREGIQERGTRGGTSSRFLGPLEPYKQAVNSSDGLGRSELISAPYPKSDRIRLEAVIALCTRSRTRSKRGWTQH